MHVGPPMRFTLTSVTPDEVKQHRAALSAWQPPATFAARNSRFIDRLTRGEFFNVPALGFLRDAWTLSKFGALAKAEEVRLSLESFPDGHASVAGQVLDIEITEAIMPGRRRGQEFLPDGPQMEEDPGHEWDRRIDALPGVLQYAIQRKAAKAYGNSPTLLVYLNITAYRYREKECLEAISRLIAQHGANFAGLYVIWQGELYGG